MIAGFFSDEPELGNVKGYPFDNMLGQKDIRLPWSDEWKENQQRPERGISPIFLHCGTILKKKTTKVRTEYMDAMTIWYIPASAVRLEAGVRYMV